MSDTKNDDGHEAERDDFGRRNNHYSTAQNPMLMGSRAGEENRSRPDVRH